MEDQPLSGNLGLQHLLEVPTDGFSFPVLVRGQVEPVGVLEQGLQFGHLLLLVRGDDVEGLELIVHVDAQAGQRGALDRLGYFTGRLGQIADVTDGRLDDKLVLVHELGDGARLGRRLDDDEGFAHADRFHPPGVGVSRFEVSVACRPARPMVASGGVCTAFRFGHRTGREGSNPTRYVQASTYRLSED